MADYHSKYEAGAPETLRKTLNTSKKEAKNIQRNLKIAFKGPLKPKKENEKLKNKAQNIHKELK